MKRYIVIADASDARIFSITNDERTLELVRQLKHPQSRVRSTEINSDRPGRLLKGMGSQRRSAMDPKTDAHIGQAHRFVAEISDDLQSECRRGHVDELALVAPPRVLGLLRKQINARALKCPRICIARNCTHVAAHDLPEALGDVLKEWLGDAAQRVAVRTKRSKALGRIA